MSLFITKKWAMPNKNTFTIKPIYDLIDKYITITNAKIICDPFVGNSPFKSFCTLTNELNPEIEAKFHEDAYDFLYQLPDNSCDMVLYDPPYSVRQVSEVYKKFNRTVNNETTRSSYWTKLKQEIARITKKDGIVISCGWNSGGIGKTLGFVQIEILLVAHGGIHNDTIVTVEQKG